MFTAPYSLFGVGTPATVTYRAFITTNGSGSTTSGVGIGTATSDRYVVIIYGKNLGTSAGNAGAFSSITIGGVSATLTNPAPVQISGTYYQRCVAVANVTSGTTADIVHTVSGSVGLSAGMVFTVTGLQSTTPFDTDTGTTAANIDIPTNGFALGIGTCLRQGFFPNAGLSFFTSQGTIRTSEVIGETGDWYTEHIYGLATGLTAQNRTISLSASSSPPATIEYATNVASFV